MVGFTVTEGLKKLGGDLKDARRRRRIKTEDMAERLGVTRATLTRMEKGATSVSASVYVRAIFSLDPDKFDQLVNIFSRENDSFGEMISDRELPQRIRGAVKL
jgi:transcriptional regulator with XRE-family HTH domain